MSSIACYSKCACCSSCGDCTESVGKRGCTRHCAKQRSGSRSRGRRSSLISNSSPKPEAAGSGGCRAARADDLRRLGLGAAEQRPREQCGGSWRRCTGRYRRGEMTLLAEGSSMRGRRAEQCRCGGCRGGRGGGSRRAAEHGGQGERRRCGVTQQQRQR